MAAIYNQKLWRRVLNHVAGDLLATVTPANLQGIIPVPHNATRINKTNFCSGVATAEVYKALADTKLFISSAFFSANSTGAAGGSSMKVYDDGDNALYTLFDNYFPTLTATVPMSNQYFPALELLAGYYVLVNTTVVGIGCLGTIHGWTEDV